MDYFKKNKKPKKFEIQIIEHAINGVSDTKELEDLFSLAEAEKLTDEILHAEM